MSKDLVNKIKVLTILGFIIMIALFVKLLFNEKFTLKKKDSWKLSHRGRRGCHGGLTRRRRTCGTEAKRVIVTW